MCVCVVCHLLFTFFLLTCSTPLWWEDLVRAPFVSHQNFVDLHLRSNFFFFSFKFTFDTNRYSFLLEIFQIWSGPWAHCKKVRLIPTVQYRSCADLLERTLSPTTWLIMRIEFSTMFFFPPFFLSKGLPAAYAAAYAGRGYPGYASFGLPYPAGKSNR